MQRVGSVVVLPRVTKYRSQYLRVPTKPSAAKTGKKKRLNIWATIMRILQVIVIVIVLRPS